MKVYCNPYGAIDHRGRLAGACPFDPEHAAGSRLHVGATLVLLKSEKRDARQQGHPDGDVREQYGFTFDAEPLTVPEEHARYYHQQARSGAIFAPRDGKPPMTEWAAARTKAIATFTAERGFAPDTSGWAEQFPTDKTIATPADKAPTAGKANQ